MRLRKRLLAVALAGLFAAPVAGACGGVGYTESRIVYRAATAPPPPRRVQVRSRPGYVWSHGHWVRYGKNWRWRAGHWVKERPNQRYAPGRWVQRGRHWVWVEPRWVDRRRHRNVEVRDHRRRY